MVERKYNQYLSDSNVNIPKSTFYLKYYNKLRLKVSCRDQTIQSLPEDQLHPNDTDNTQELYEFESQDDDIDQNTNELNENQPLDTTSIDLIIDDLTAFVVDNTITKEDVASAFLAAFYDGAATQKSLTSFLTLSNIMNKTIQIPTTFSGLVSLLNGNKKNLIIKNHGVVECANNYLKN